MKSRVCRSCELYLPSTAAVTRHRKGGCNTAVNVSASGMQQSRPTLEDEVNGNLSSDEDASMPAVVPETVAAPAVYRNIFDALSTPWESMD